MKRIFACTLAVLCVLPLLGFARAPKALFTIRHGNWAKVVTRGDLETKWYNVAERDKITDGKSIRDRIESGESVAEIDALVARVSKKFYAAPFDGNVHFSPNEAEKFRVVGAKSGIAVDKGRLAEQICAAVLSKKHRDIWLEFEEVLPKDSAEMLGGIVTRAEFATKLSATGSRTENVRLALSKFNGMKIAKGERVSFNKIVGPRTSERGFKTAKIIMDGDFVDGVGGGVCQASTTLFNAVLSSGLRVVESHNHSLEIGYVKVGRDAMVSSASDLVFQNTTRGDVFVESGVVGGRAFVKIYGAKSPVRYVPRVELTRVHDKKMLVKGDDMAKNDDFEKVVVEHGKNPKSTKTYLDVYKGVKVVSRTLVRKSYYIGREEVVTYRRKPEEPRCA